MTLKEQFGKLFLRGHDTTDFEKIAKDYSNSQIEKICDSDNLDKIIHSKSLAEARRIIRTLTQQE